MSQKTPGVTIVTLFLLFGAGIVWAQTPASQPDPSAQDAASAQNESPSANRIPEDIPGLQAMAIQSYEDGEYLRFIQATIMLRKQRPYEQQYLVGMVVGAALIGRPSTAYNYMHVMQQQGLSYDFNSTEDTQSIRDTEVYAHLNDLLIKAGEPMGDGGVAFTLPPTAVQPESIAWDSGRGKFLIGTIDSGAVQAVTPAGEVEELIRASDDNGLLAITGIAVDETRKRLWLSSAGVPGFSALVPTDLGRGALFEFDLESMELLNRFDIPVDGLPHAPGRVVVTPAGDVYLIDHAVPMVFRKLAGSKKLEPYLASKELVGFKDMAMSDSGDLLYIADAELGILVVNVGKDTSAMLTGPESLNLGGISGLTFSEGKLFLLQNGITPNRLLSLELDQDGMNVSSIAPVAIALELFDAPSFGTIKGGSVYYFAGSNSAGGVGEPGPTVVLKSPLVLSEAIIPVEQRKFDADTAGKIKNN